MDEVEAEPKPGKYPSLDDILNDEEPQFLLPCTICNKTFNPESLQRHSKICEKNASRKRKKFDSFKQRVQGTGMAEFLSLSTIKKNEKPSSPRKAVNTWKEKHEAFVSAIRAARDTTVTNGRPTLSLSSDSRSLLLSRPPDHEQCPHCGRSFGPKSFDRHLEWCRDQRQRQPPSVASQQARERLEARIKYRAPPCKSKRSLMREKYSPLAQRKVCDTSPTSPSPTNMSKSFSAGSTKSQPPERPVRYNRSASTGSQSSGRHATREAMKETDNNPGLSRGGLSRTSIRASQRAAQRSVSPKKPTSSASKPVRTPPYRPSSRASDRRSDESLSMIASSTESALFDPIVQKSPHVKRKDRTSATHHQTAPHVPKIESNRRSRKNSEQRPRDPFLTFADSKNPPSPQPYEEDVSSLPFRVSHSPNSESSFHTDPPKSRLPFKIKTHDHSKRDISTNNGLPRGCVPTSPLSKEWISHGGHANDFASSTGTPDMLSESGSDGGTDEVMSKSIDHPSDEEKRRIKLIAFTANASDYRKVADRTEHEKTCSIPVAVKSYSGTRSEKTDETTRSARSEALFEFGTRSNKSEGKHRSALGGSISDIGTQPNKPIEMPHRVCAAASADFGTRSDKTGEKAQSVLVSSVSDVGARSDRKGEKARSICAVASADFGTRSDKTGEKAQSVLVSSGSDDRARSERMWEKGRCVFVASMSGCTTGSVRTKEKARSLKAPIKFGGSNGTNDEFAIPASRKRRRVYVPCTPRCVDMFQKVIPEHASDRNSVHPVSTAKNVSGKDEVIDYDEPGDDSSDDSVLTDENYRGKRASCSAGTYTKEKSSLPDDVRSSLPDDVRSSLPDDVLRSPSIKRDDLACDQRSTTPQSSKLKPESPFCLIPKKSSVKQPFIVSLNEKQSEDGGIRKTPGHSTSLRSKSSAVSGKPVKNYAKSKARKVMQSNTTSRQSSSPCGGWQVRSQMESPSGLPSLPTISCSKERISPERNQQQPFCVHTATVTTCHLQTSLITTAVLPAPQLIIKKKSSVKLLPLRSTVPVAISLSATSDTSSRPMSTYDPYQSAERQMFELFNSDSAADMSVVAENLKNQEKTVVPSSSPSISPSHSPTPCPPLETSPTSAFTRYSKESDTELRSLTPPPSPLATPPETAPAPPPRQHRSVSGELPSITTSVSAPKNPKLVSHHSVDVPKKSDNEKKPFRSKRSSEDDDQRPRTYDIHAEERPLVSPTLSNKDDSSPDVLVVIATPPVSPPPSPPPDFVELRKGPVLKPPKESRESREIRELTAKSKSPSPVDHFRADSPLAQKFLELDDELCIDNLMEEVVRMQQYVALMSNPVQSRSKNQTAKIRRSRASKMHIEDYLYPADSPMRGSTPIMGDTLSTPTIDLDVNANTDEDNDVVVSPNAVNLKPGNDASSVDNDRFSSSSRPKDIPLLSSDSSRVPRGTTDFPLGKADFPQGTSENLARPSERRRRIRRYSDDEEVVRSSPSSPVPRMSSNRQSTGSRLSGDSAYSSLNRKSPIPSSKGTAPVRPARQSRCSDSPISLLSQSLQAQSLSRDLSSSSSESSLHAVSSSLSSRRPDANAVKGASSTLSKFCHECGTKYPVLTAKFCPECGARRIVV